LAVANENRTRDAVARLVLESGPQTAVELAERLEISPAAVRRHLDALVQDGLLVECEPRRVGPEANRGRGRPPRAYALTDAGRAAFPHGYDDLATMALRYLKGNGGPRTVTGFAEERAHQLEVLLARHGATPQSLAVALTQAGYAANTEQTPSGVQVCQHHCPVAHVAAEFPELCEAETRAFERILGTYVQRLATIARGDGVCTTYVPDPPARPRPGPRHHPPPRMARPDPAPTNSVRRTSLDDHRI
jgi:predicted ArsR family transcriptional regulator